MLNPSTADQEKNDPTVERCERRARRTPGCGGVEIINIFAFRETSPELMKKQVDPVGPDNDRHILEAASKALKVICGWGIHGEHMGRGDQVVEMLTRAGILLYCLKQTSSGQPSHPLYIGYGVVPKLLKLRQQVVA